MKMSSLEYKQLLNQFGADLQEINDDLYQATKPKASPEERSRVMRVARAKMTEYQQLLEQLQGAQRDEAERSFGELMSEMASFTSQLEQGS